MNISTLNMSHLIASDAPVSPISDWDLQCSPTRLGFSLDYNYELPSPSRSSVGSISNDSPMPVSRMLKGRSTPDTPEPEQLLCLPTHQVFDLTPAPAPEVFSSPFSQSDLLPPLLQLPSASVIPAKRASSVTPTATKKPRASTSVREFVPPDVTGLSKREARLVKNRAAAFLSRQRKREEFEQMEHRVAELEEENARLLASVGGVKEEAPQQNLLSEVEQLRAQLAAAEARERELAEELSRKSVEAAVPVKTEVMEPQFPSSRASSVQPSHKSGASLGLMVLLCALPTLLSLPTHSAVPTTFSLPISNSVSASSFDLQSYVPNDFDWFSPTTSLMDLDNTKARLGAATAFPIESDSPKRLEFVDEDADALGLSGLDISFDAMPSQDGKIRVRIHPPTSSAASSPAAHTDSDDQTMWNGSDSGANTESDKFGPFLGFGDYGMSLPSTMSVDSSNDLASQTGMSFPSVQPMNDYSFEKDFGVSTPAGRKRVRIALKSLPGEGREGGEWEVQVC